MLIRYRVIIFEVTKHIRSRYFIVTDRQTGPCTIRTKSVSM